MDHFYANIDGWLDLYQVENLFTPVLRYLPPGDLKLAEIGVYKGRSTAIFNVYFTTLGYNLTHYVIDHFSGSIEHESEVDCYLMALENLKPLENKVTILKKDSITASQDFKNGFLI